ncbi:MAG: hypothetical protein LAQ30_09080, partial [Acidobacteriia bacterium]|nr:hypothetical protein [Terriglobia bacterium]
AVAAAPALLVAVGSVLSWSMLPKNYQTQIPLDTFEAMMFVVVGLAAGFGFVMLTGASAFLLSFFPQSVSSLRAANRRALAVDAAAALAAAIGISVALAHLRAVLTTRFPAQALFSIDSPDVIASAAPALSAIASAARSLLLRAAELAVIVVVIRKTPKRWMLAPLALAGLFALLPGSIRTPGELALYYGLALLAAAGAALFCLSFARNNYLAYALVFWTFALREPMAALFGTATPALHVQAWVIAAAMALAIVWAVYPALVPKRETAEAAAS